MQRYFCNQDSDLFTLSRDDSYHITKVMRYNIGTTIEIVCNNTLYLSEITSLTPFVVAKKIASIDNDSKSLNVTITQSLVKEQKMDYILQKGTELGVKEFIPLITTRSVVKIDKKEDKKINRWNLIVKEASEQSKRLDVPLVNRPYNIKELSLLKYDYKILCTVNELSKSIKTVLSNIQESDRILIVVGPEGGFTKEEEECLINNGFISVSLGSRVLRTETASLFVLSIINYILMR